MVANVCVALLDLDPSDGVRSEDLKSRDAGVDAPKVNTSIALP